MAARVSHANDKIDDLASNYGTLVSKSPQGALSATTVTRTSYALRLVPFGLAFEHSKTTESSVTEKRERPLPGATTVIGSVRLPTWFLQQQCDVQVRRAASGWTFSMQVHAVVPRDSPFSMACRDGDLDRVKDLLKSKSASIYDRTSDKETALTFAALKGRLDVCHFLSAHGVHAQFGVRDYAMALKAFTVFHRESHDVTTLEACMRIVFPDEDLRKESMFLPGSLANSLPRALRGGFAAT